MSKKLIAVASAAALALSALVGVAPANASVFAVAVTGLAGMAPGQTAESGVAATSAMSINVPSADVIRFDSTADTATGTALRLDIDRATASTPIVVKASAGIKLYSATAFADSPTVAKGLSEVTDTTSSLEGIIVYAVSTSTAAQTITVTNEGNSKTIFVKGLSNFPYKMNLTSSASAGLGGKITVTGTVKDAFGNDLTSPLNAASSADWTLTEVVGATGGTLKEYDSTTKVYTFEFTAPSTAAPVAFNIKPAAEHTSAKVDAFGTPVLSQFFSVNVVDLATQVKTLEAQVAALQVIVDRKVTKKRYNTLARKWNRAFPSQKVWVKP